MVDVESDQRENENAGGCVVHYSWRAPTKIDATNISYFVVIFDNAVKRVSNTNNNVYTMEQSVCTCDSHNISIFAVDVCGQTGPTRSHVVSKVSNSTCEDSTFDHTDPPSTDKDSTFDHTDEPSMDTIDINDGKNVPLVSAIQIYHITGKFGKYEN